MGLFLSKVNEYLNGGLTCADISTIQVNVGLVCNQSCRHCHVQASPERTEVMTWEVMEDVTRAADAIRPELIDITGGAPELGPHIREFIQALTEKGHAVQIRTNLTAMTVPGLEDMPEFLAGYNVRLTASMPCYLEENVNAQRGGGVYGKSVEVMKKLNSLGYGINSTLPLDLVYNPGGAFLPPGQAKLEDDYRQKLRERFGIEFTNLLTITNMPLGRFWAEMRKENKDDEYMRLLMESFNPQTIDGLMCRHQISVGWDGKIYDCDFNLALGMPVDVDGPPTIGEADISKLAGRDIVTGLHCFGCTAGCGSSCKGALAK
jgi:radical SAM/Cys-rich protein